MVLYLKFHRYWHMLTKLYQNVLDSCQIDLILIIVMPHLLEYKHWHFDTILIIVKYLLLLHLVIISLMYQLFVQNHQILKTILKMHDYNNYLNQTFLIVHFPIIESFYFCRSVFQHAQYHPSMPQLLPDVLLSM